MAVASPSSSSPMIVDSKLSDPPPLEQPNPNPDSDTVPSSVPSAPDPNPYPESLPPPVPISNPSFLPAIPPPMPAGVATPPPAPSYPSFSPVTPVPGASAPLPFTPGVNSMIQPPGVAVATGLPPGVSVIAAPPQAMPYPRPMYTHMPNGYRGVPMPVPGHMPPPGILRYPNPFMPVVRPIFPPRPPGVVGAVPSLTRPPFLGIRMTAPMTAPFTRPDGPIFPVAEKPQTTVYVGKIAGTVDNDFLLSLLRLCGPVKSWKRAQDPSNGAPKGFGFCEFESAEGVLRALRLLSKFSVDGQELVLNVNQATREYLERYVEMKKTEKERSVKATSVDTNEKEATVPVVEKEEPPKVASTDQSEKGDSSPKTEEDSKKFGIVTDEDQEADSVALQTLKSMMEERYKNRPPPPPPPPPTFQSESDMPSKSRDGDSDVDMRNDTAEGRHDNDISSENKPSESERADISPSIKGRGHDRRNRDRDREHDSKREKDREMENLERERERDRVRRERDRELKTRESDRVYKDRVKDWEAREREKEYQRQHERDKEKEKERERRREVKDQEDESDDDDTSKRRRRSSSHEERRRKRQREKEDDMADKLREEEEIAEATKRAVEEQKKQEELKLLSSQAIENEKVNQDNHMDSKWHDSQLNNGNDFGDLANGDEGIGGSIAASESRPNNNAPTRKLGFGLVGSGKRNTTVPSLFKEEEEDEADDKKMRPLVPIDYSTEELQAAQLTPTGTPSNLAAAAEFAKRFSNANPKDERFECERERHRRSGDRSIHRDRDRDRGDEEIRERTRDRGHERDRDREHVTEKGRASANKILDAKQLIDMIPKTKEELFAYEINWVVYDKHDLHERMQPWISKKITEFLGEEEATLVEYIVSSLKDHMKASQILELLQSILDEEAEMFVLKMWRMLIFEIKKVETGRAATPKS